MSSDAVNRAYAKHLASGHDPDAMDVPSERQAFRDVLREELHRDADYIGRAFATLASLILGIAVYDTQCGAKLFRNIDPVRGAFEHPFGTRWCFDVEIFSRLLRAVPNNEGRPEDRFTELPLSTWIHRAGSKLRPSHAPRILLELVHVARETRRQRA